MSETAERPEVVTEYRAEMGKGLFVNGREFPFYVAMEPGWRVEPLSNDLHVLWLPLIVDGALPEYGEPDGEPLPTDEPVEYPTTPATTAGRDESEA